jgi:1-phosphofructokinase family hexose kinase
MIYTATINPAIDKILFMERFVRSRTNRLSRTMETIGGKGTHVSINLNLLGVKNIALGVAFGQNGKKIINLLHTLGVKENFLFYEIEGFESRTNYEIVEATGHACTMLTERGPVLPRQITDDLINQIQELIKEGDSLILTGDASNVEDTAIYSRVTKIARDLGVRVFLDASGNYLIEGLASYPFLIKPNLEELSFVAGRNLKTVEEIVTTMRELDRYNIPVITMTWSNNGAIVKFEDDFFRVHPVKVNAVNEAGCGDAFLSAMVAGLDAEENIIHTLKNAGAIAAATAESELTVGFEPARAKELFAKVIVEKIPG